MSNQDADMTYKYWLFKNNKKDSKEAFHEYYIWWVHNTECEYCSFDKMPHWLQEATINEAYKTRFIVHLY